METVNEKVERLLKKLTPETQMSMIEWVKHRAAMDAMEYVLSFMDQWESTNEVDGLFISIVAEVISKMSHGMKKLNDTCKEGEITGRLMAAMIVDSLNLIAVNIKRDLGGDDERPKAACCSCHAGGYEECKD